MTTYISPSLPGMISNLWKSDPSERSVRTALNLAGDLIQELIDLRDQPSERSAVENADTGGTSAEPSDAEVLAAASAMFDVADEQMRFPTGFDQAPEPLADTYRRMARAALEAAREVS